jgi:hypothetical protein
MSICLTKDDFYRMELDKLDDVHPLNRPHMRKAYFAYLQNTPGSKKAITECVCHMITHIFNCFDIIIENPFRK